MFNFIKKAIISNRAEETILYEYVLDELVSNPKKTQLVGINDKNGNGRNDDHNNACDHQGDGL